MQEKSYAASQGMGRMMERLCLICQITGGALLAVMPLVLRAYLRFKYESPEQAIYAPMLALLYVSGACAFMVLQHGRMILRNIGTGDPFTQDTARRAHAISRWCLPIGLSYLVGIFAIPSPLVLLVGLAFLFLSVLVFIVAGVFDLAVRYKQENDLTI